MPVTPVLTDVIGSGIITSYAPGDLIDDLPIVTAVHDSRSRVVRWGIVTSRNIDPKFGGFWHGWICENCGHRFFGEDCGCNSDQCRECNHIEAVQALDDCDRGDHEWLYGGVCTYCPARLAEVTV